MYRIGALAVAFVFVSPPVLHAEEVIPEDTIHALLVALVENNEQRIKSPLLL
jgi:hypothetical protein